MFDYPFVALKEHYADAWRITRRELNRKHGARQVRLMLKKQTRKQFEETLERRQKLDALIRRSRKFSFSVVVPHRGFLSKRDEITFMATAGGALD